MDWHGYDPVCLPGYCENHSLALLPPHFRYKDLQDVRLDHDWSLCWLGYIKRAG